MKDSVFIQDGINGADFCRPWVDFIQMLHNSYFVGNGDTGTANPKPPNPFDSCRNIFNLKGEIASIQTAMGQSAVVHYGAQAVPNRIADNRVQRFRID